MVIRMAVVTEAKKRFVIFALDATVTTILDAIEASVGLSLFTLP